MKRILLSLAMIGAVAAIAVSATAAYFSDTETSTGNTFSAGAIDLKIDNHSYTTDMKGNLVLSATTTWDLRDLTVEKFFDFSDVKPGDRGEDTISIHVDNNDSYVCAKVKLTSDNENTLVDPEVDAGDTTTSTGELASQINFIWWADDGDNVLETGETVLPGGNLGQLGVGNTATVALADSVTNIWSGQSGPLPGGSVRYIAKGWCYGAIAPTPLSQDGQTTQGPLERLGTGFSCNGAAVTNISQTDSMTADISFEAVQSRNNADFRCVPLPVVEVPVAG